MLLLILQGCALTCVTVMGWDSRTRKEGRQRAAPGLGGFPGAAHTSSGGIPSPWGAVVPCSWQLPFYREGKPRESGTPDPPHRAEAGALGLLGRWGDWGAGAEAGLSQ